MVIRAALFIALFAIQASAQLRVKGRTLEVASERIRVVFDGGDLVRADNLLTRESVAHGAAKGSPTARLIRANGTAEETLSLGLETVAVGPWASATSIQPVEWRLDCFRGTWMNGADIYRRASARDWEEPALPAAANWVRDIRTVITLA